MRAFLFIPIFLCSAQVMAVSPKDPHVRCSTPATIALDGNAEARTLTLPLEKKFTGLKIHVSIAYATSGAVTLKATKSFDGVTYAPFTTQVCASGVCTHYVKSDVFTPSETYTLVSYSYPVYGVSHIKLLFAEPGNDSTDVLTVQACYTAGE
jgi:hypothetical protein